MEVHQRELAGDAVDFVGVDRQMLRRTPAQVQPGGQPLGDGEHAVVRIDGDNGTASAHPPQGRTGNHARAGTDIEQAVPVDGLYRVEHRLDPLAEQRRHKELFVDLSGCP